MADDTELAAPEAVNLDTILDSAIEQHTPKDDAPAADVAAEASPRADATGRLHGQDGKFVAKTDSAAEAAPEGIAAETAKPAEPAQPVEPAPPTLDPPARWTADDKAKFTQWPRDIQEMVLARAKEEQADFTRKTQEAAELRKASEPLLNAVKPYQEYLSRIAPAVGQTPDQMVASLLGVEYQLRTGDPYQKAQALHQIAQSYGIDLAAMSRGELPAAPDPAFTQLRQSFGTIEQRLAHIESEREAERTRQTAQSIEDFRKAADTTGRPLHPYFDRVRGVMGQILTDDPSLTLKAAYDKAIEPIQQAIADGLKSQQETAERERLAAVEKAKKAAPVRSSGSQPNGVAKGKGLDEILSAAIDARMA